MTPPDSGPPDPGSDNPFDLGLPMLRPPARRRPSRRGAPRRRPPRRDPLPIPGSGDHSGGWEEWLDQGVRQPNPEPAAPPPPMPAREYDYGDPDNAALVPKIVDRTGASAGSRLRRARPRTGNAPPSRDKIISVLILAGIAIVVVSVILTVLHTGKHRHPGMLSAPAPTLAGAAAASAAPSSSASDVPSVPGVIASDGCEQRHDADVVSGTDPGGTGSAPDAILAFERAYYVQRSGYAARAVVAPDAKVPAADQIQRGINKTPVGTRYCVSITRGSPDGTQWEVRLTEQKPTKDPKTYTQIITTQTVGGRTLIAAIADGG
ncbi:hypothetical protein ABIA39_003714 [Nocardia sp. GAS34]|uniref:hypothetical protein n=1 Tax=unclassified Nocardia TaxID=2637762 RepID=UPI003D1C1C36